MTIPRESITKRNRIISEHRLLILELRRIEEDIARMLGDSNSRWRELENERNAKLRKVEALVDEYWDWIPSISLSRCPFCNADLLRAFDPVDLNGFWWMDRTQRPCSEPESCEHFRLLLGAVNLNRLPPKGGLFECRPGPDVPYIIPRILEMSTMEAVISSIPIHCGYTAYPVAYYSQKPPASGSLTQSWAQKQYRFTSATGTAGWSIVVDSCDFDLLPWLKTGKVRWCKEGKLSPKDADPKTCPFLGLEGVRRPQILFHNELRYE